MIRREWPNGLGNVLPTTFVPEPKRSIESMVRLTFKPVGPLKDKARGSFFWSKIVEYSS